MVVDLVIHDGIPDGAATAIGDPSAVIAPCDIADVLKCGIGHFAIRLFLRIGDRVEPPDLVAGIRIIGRDVAAHTQLRAAIADQHFAVHHARRAGDRVGLGLVDGYLAPDDFAGFGVQRLQPAINDTDINLAIIDSDPAVHDITTGLNTHSAIHVRIIDPQLFACLCVQRVDQRPGRSDIHYTVNHDGGRFHAAICRQIIGPCHAEIGDRVRVDVRQAGMALLIIGAAICQPFLACAGSADALGVDRREGFRADALGVDRREGFRFRRWGLIGGFRLPASDENCKGCPCNQCGLPVCHGGSSPCSFP